MKVPVRAELKGSVISSADFLHNITVYCYVQPIIKLREVKQLKETAVCESLHGGVRGRGSNPLLT